MGDRLVARPDNATAIVTGASKGIGAAIAKALAADGWYVAVNYRSDEDGANATVEAIEEAGGKAVARAGLELDDIDLFVYHQANGRIISAVGQRLDLEPARVADYVAHMANTSAASIPLTLSLLREDGRLRPGQRVLVAAIGAGFTWGAGVLEWGVAYCSLRRARAPLVGRSRRLTVSSDRPVAPPLCPSCVLVRHPPASRPRAHGPIGGSTSVAP